MQPIERPAQARPRQPEFIFNNGSPPGSHPPTDGLASWREELTEAMRKLAMTLGLPISHQVEVCLKDGVILRGNLRVGEVLLSLEKFDRNKMALQVDGVIFFYGEIESCVRLD